tara:strand:- start:95 stop:718 length:624 start_codon:yes stop_codon:yes gene_type:complete
MSWEALSWAAQQTAGGSTDKLVLIILANFADENGASFPSHKTIAQKAECGLSTVERSLKRLEARGLVSIDPRFDSGPEGSNRQTSNLYTLKMGGVILTGGGGIQNGDPVTSNKETKGRQMYSSGFLEWWNAYPANNGSKKKSYELWLKAIDEFIDERDLFLITCKFAQTQQGKDVRYIPHATTWLNQRRWETVDMKEPKKTLNSLAG